MSATGLLFLRRKRRTSNFHAWKSIVVRLLGHVGHTFVSSIAVTASAVVTRIASVESKEHAALSAGVGTDRLQGE